MGSITRLLWSSRWVKCDLRPIWKEAKHVELFWLLLHHGETCGGSSWQNWLGISPWNNSSKKPNLSLLEGTLAEWIPIQLENDPNISNDRNHTWESSKLIHDKHKLPDLGKHKLQNYAFKRETSQLLVLLVSSTIFQTFPNGSHPLPWIS